MGEPVYFLSYSRKDLSQAKAIVQTLLAHGIGVWQDIGSLGQGIAESTIREAIGNLTDGLVMFVTPRSVASSFIRSVELPEADRRYKQDQGFQIVPVFAMPIDAATADLKACLTIPISNFNGAEVGGTGEARDVLQAARRAAEIILANLRIQSARPLLLGLSSKQRVSGTLGLHLDFMSYFSDALPTSDEWDEHITVALNTVKTALVRRDILVLRLRAFCHLSLGYLFGYVFRSTTGYQLETEQITGGVRSTWSTHTEPQANPLQMVELPGDLTSKDLCVRINLMSGDDSAVRRYSKESNMSYRAVLELSPTGYPCMISGHEAAAIARDLAGKIKELHARYDTNTVHLFAAIPFGLSVLIGYNLNACGTIQCYEFDNGRRTYSRSCRFG